MSVCVLMKEVVILSELLSFLPLKKYWVCVKYSLWFHFINICESERESSVVSFDNKTISSPFFKKHWQIKNTSFENLYKNLENLYKKYLWSKSESVVWSGCQGFQILQHSTYTDHRPIILSLNSTGISGFKFQKSFLLRNPSDSLAVPGQPSPTTLYQKSLANNNCTYFGGSVWTQNNKPNI